MRDERDYVVETITAFVTGTGGPFDWRRFTVTALRDTELERIRRCAAAVDLPLDADGIATLLALRSQAELVAAHDVTQPRPWRVERGMALGLVAGALLWWINYLPGADLFRNLHLLLLPIGAGALIVILRNSRLKVGAFDPKVVAQNQQGRV